MRRHSTPKWSSGCGPRCGTPPSSGGDHRDGAQLISGCGEAPASTMLGQFSGTRKSYQAYSENAMRTETSALAELAGTGIPGLDDVVRGGYPRNRMYLVQGDPGSG